MYKVPSFKAGTYECLGARQVLTGSGGCTMYSAWLQL